MNNLATVAECSPLNTIPFYLFHNDIDGLIAAYYLCIAFRENPMRETSSGAKP